MDNTVLQRVRELLANKGIPQLRIAEAMGIRQNTFSRQVNGESALSAAVLSAIIEYFPDASTEWLLTGRGEMLKSEETAPIVKVNYEGKGVPYYADLPVSAGQLDTFVQQSKPTGWVNLPGVNSKALFPVIGCSMKPEINPGDVVGIVQIDSWEVLDPDKTYLIITHDERMIKHLAVDEEDDSVLWCISPNYPKFKINKADIKHLYRISFCAKLM